MRALAAYNYPPQIQHQMMYGRSALHLSSQVPRTISEYARIAGISTVPKKLASLYAQKAATNMI